jgi:hypothetical protein
MNISALAKDSDNIIIIMDGDSITFDVQPQIMNNRTMVPLRAIFEAMGLEVEWIEETQTVIGKTDDTIIELKIGDENAYVNNALVILDQPALIIDDRTLVPVRFIAESTGADVNWLEEKSTVEIISSENILADRLGLDLVYYPKVNEYFNSMDYAIRAGYGMAESTGEGYAILAVGELKDKSYSNATDRTKAIFEYMVPETTIHYTRDLEDVDEMDYDVVVLYDETMIFNIEAYIINETATYFIIPGDMDETTEGVEMINKLSQYDNVLIVGAVEYPSMMPYRIENDDLLLTLDIDVFAPYHYSDWSNDAALSEVAASVVLVDDTFEIDNLQEYYQKNNKVRDMSYWIDGFKMNILDMKLLFQKAGTYDFATKMYNLNSSDTGEGVRVFMLDSSYDPTDLDLIDYVDEIYTFSEEGYSLITEGNLSAHGNSMTRVLKNIAPDADVSMVLQQVLWTDDVSENDKYRKEALRWIIDNYQALDVDILSMSWGVNYIVDEELLELLKEVADLGIIISWPRVPFEYSNIIRPYEITSASNSLDDLADPIENFEVYVYNRYFDDYETNEDLKWGISQTSPAGAGLAAVIKSVKPDITGDEIVQLYLNYALRLNDMAESGIPDMSRITRFLKNDMTYIRDIEMNFEEVSFIASDDYELIINGVDYEASDDIRVPFNEFSTVILEKDDNRIIEGTQKIDLDLLQNSQGDWVIESTFNGSILANGEEIKLAEGYTEIEYEIFSIEGLTIEY